MMNTFDEFCMDHCCAKGEEHRSSYCPIADEVMQIYGAVGGRKCESVYRGNVKEREQ